MTTVESIRAARRCGTPIICVRTADPSACIARIRASLTSKDPTPVIRWDIVRGALGEDEASAEVLQNALKQADMEQASTTNPTEFLVFSRRLPKLTIIFMMNLHRFASEDIGVIQALWNLRDEFKFSNKCVIGLCPNITLPAELSQDVLVLDEPLPTDVELKAIAVDIYNAAQLPQPENIVFEKIIDATLGLAAFPAEQSMAMSITKKGMDITELWERKRGLIAQADGLSVVKPDLTFNDIGGVSNVKNFITRIMNGAEPPRTFVFIDEGEKAFAGSSVGAGDSSGVSQNFLGTLLTDMQDNNYSGTIFIGFPGSAKSMVAKCAGATAGVPTIQFDLAGMKNSLVGASEANLRKALSVVKAVSQGRAFFIMTTNGIATLPPELKRRFRAGLWMFDFPVKAEREVIWKLYLAKYADRLKGLDLTIPNDENWTGAEISVCVDNAYKLRCSLIEASAYIVPVYHSMGAEKVAQLRSEANGRYISASYPGPYQHKRQDTPMLQTAGRSINFGDN